MTFYLDPKTLKQAREGRHNFIGRISGVLTEAGLQVAFDEDGAAARLRADDRDGRGLFLGRPPPNDRGLTFSLTYLFPFWRIEKQDKSWQWPVAEAAFEPDSQNRQAAENFQRFWRDRLFDLQLSDVDKAGFVYVPLQDKLVTKRGFQVCSPIDMIKGVLEHETARDVIVTLDPQQKYSEEETRALDALVAAHDRLRLESTGQKRHLRDCDFVVTQNARDGFLGMFLRKPVVLFARADYHHIALNVLDMGVEKALLKAQSHDPDFASYQRWFLQERAINAGRKEAQDKIRMVLRSHDWPV